MQENIKRNAYHNKHLPNHHIFLYLHQSSMHTIIRLELKYSEKEKKKLIKINKTNFLYSIFIFSFINRKTLFKR